jgi:succinate dehydrogenase flavin-adding protein (antitoxin of CptAB toxin-antitoxin module)
MSNYENTSNGSNNVVKETTRNSVRVENSKPSRFNKIQKGFLTTTKKIGNSTKSAFLSIDLKINGYKDSENYDTLLKNFKIKNYENKNLNELTSEELKTHNRLINENIKGVFNFFNKSLKRDSDEVVKGYKKMQKFNDEVGKILKKIKDDIKNYNKLELDNRKYYKKMVTFLKEIEKKYSHNNNYYKAKTFTGEQAKIHNEKKIKESIKYSKFYLYKIFKNLYEIIKIKNNIKGNVFIINELYKLRSNNIMNEYLESISNDINNYTEVYEKYIESYESSMRGAIENKNKAKVISKVKNYYNSSGVELPVNKNNSSTNSVKTNVTNVTNVTNSYSLGNVKKPNNLQKKPSLLSRFSLTKSK